MPTASANATAMHHADATACEGNRERERRRNLPARTQPKRADEQSRSVRRLGQDQVRGWVRNAKWWWGEHKKALRGHEDAAHKQGCGPQCGGRRCSMMGGLQSRRFAENILRLSS